nr:thiamine pyrophosphate-dependent dehydrogenase E1 component subunit alpha [Gemmatimonadaceae bacterium]
NQSYVPEGEIEWWAANNDPLDRYVRELTTVLGFTPEDVASVDARVTRDVDEATDIAEASPTPEPLDALEGVYADPPREQPLWFRRDVTSAVERHERPEGWGTWNAGGNR